MQLRNPLLAPLALAAAMALSACSGDKSSSGSKLAGEATFDPAPVDQSTIQAQLKRFKGQTKFLTPYDRYYSDRFSTPLPAGRADAAVGGARAMQESDIFKIGKPGSKLVYLLNNYRGLQVVSFEAGAEQPALLGRVDATGNYPTAMYYDAAHDHLIVLENNYQREDGQAYDYSDLQSRLVVYDVAVPTSPKIAQVIDLKGSLSESRMVGEVLYVATTVRPNWNAGEQTSKGYVYSFDLTATEVGAVETHELAGGVTWGENMNVVEVKDGAAYKYYLIAILAKSAWSWGDRESLVEVVDISDAQGDIKPLMVVNTKGVVRERSQTHVKNGTLIVTSNSLAADQTTLRVAVETFTLPTATSEVLTSGEADYRKLHVERELKKQEKILTAQGVTGDALVDALKAYKDTLIADAELGLKGRFVKASAENGADTLLKLQADSVITTGSTQGLSAAVQDVRYEGDLLYVYWVPSNNIDPLDVFDISAPQDGVKYLSRLEFDGWIQRAIPLTHAGRQYILGLGWVIPAVGDDTQRRYPQAVLFEISKTPAGRVRAEVLAQKNLGSSSTWTDFQAQDKMIEVRSTGDGTGVVMYTFSSWDAGKWLNGGKLIGFDLKQADLNPDAVFAEGGVLAGDDGWLRRVFTNPEIDRINTFSDMALGVYDVGTGIGAANAIVNASATLELARNVQAYVSLAKGSLVRGVQVVSDYSWSYDGDSITELRLVGAGKADAEKAQALATLKLEGTYVDAEKASDGDLLVFTQRYSRVANSADDWGYEVEYFVHKVALGTDGALSLSAKTSWEPAEGTVGPRLGWQQELIVLANGRALAATGAQAKEIVISATGLVAQDLAFEGCTFEGVESAGLKVVAGKLYVTFSEVVKDLDVADLNYLRNFVSAVSDDAGVARCGTPVNIPGHVVNVVDGVQVVTQDSRLIDHVRRGTGEYSYMELVTESALASLALGADAAGAPLATLVDLYDPKNVAVDSMKVLDGDKLVFIESTARQSYGWGWGRGGFGGAVRSDSIIGRPWPYQTQTENRLAILGFDDTLGFTKVQWTLTLPGNTAAVIRTLVPSLKAGEGYLAAVAQGQTLQVLALDGVSRPVAKQLAKVQADGTRAELADSVKLAGYYYSWSDDNGVHFTPSQRSFELAQGIFGVAQVFVAD